MESNINFYRFFGQKNTSGKDFELHFLLTKHLYSTAQYPLLVNVLLAILFVYVQSSSISLHKLLSWLLVILLVTLARASLTFTYRRMSEGSKSGMKSPLLKFRIGVIASGLVWGMTGLFATPVSQPAQLMFLIFTLAGLTAGAVISYSADFISAVAFSSLSVLPLSICLIATGEPQYIAMGLAVALYVCFIIFYGKHTSRIVVENNLFRLEALEREERYRSLVNNLPIGIFNYDKNFTITFCNEKLAEILNSSVKNIIGLKLCNFKDQSIRPAINGALEGNVTNYEDLYTTSVSNIKLWIHMSCAPIFDLNGKVFSVVAFVQDITERKLMAFELEEYRKSLENQLEEESTKYRDLFTNSPAGIAIANSFDGRIQKVNPTLLHILGYSEEEISSKSIIDITHPSDQSFATKKIIALSQSDGLPISYEQRLLRKDGVWIWSEISISGLKNNAGEVTRLVVNVIDISDRKKASTELLIAAKAFEVQEAIYITDENRAILRVNQTFTQMTGYSAQEVIGKEPQLLMAARQFPEFYGEMWDSVFHTGAWEGETWSRRKNGETFQIHLSVTSVKNSDGVVSNYVASFQDISLRKKSEEEIKQLAFYDTLTGLPNRRLLLERLKHALATSHRNGKKCALLLIDLDNFKTINDTMGHAAGDTLLRKVAQRLSQCIRETDTVARLGGDEFIILLEDLPKDATEAGIQTESIGMKLIKALATPYDIENHNYISTASIGATIANDVETSDEDLLKQADISMYQAKISGRNKLYFFDPKMQDDINARVALEDELRNALKQEQFQLYYQIQVDSERRPIGAEALVRWIHPERGIIPPATFIQLAEEDGLILPIGRWVLKAACAQVKQWEGNELTKNIILAVNISSLQFHQAGFIDEIRDNISKYDINPKLLKLELTESILLENTIDAIAAMNSLKALGIRLALDDFGTGYSSLQYLKRLSMDELKIDQSFVKDIATDHNDMAIVSTIIAMAKNMGMDVIAEGVETQEQFNCLQKHGCTNFQGYLFGKPMPASQFERLMSSKI